MLVIAFYIAITVEAMTAALAAGRRNMDWFGVCLIACVTALGGGTMRDILLDHYPLVWVQNPYVLLLVCGAALATIPLARLVDRLKWPFLLLDALGLVVFTVIGCNIGIEAGVHPIIVIVAGMVTGTAGGVLRDVLCNDIPLIFQGELYATVSLITGVIYYFGLVGGLPGDLVVLIAIAVGFTLRVMALVLKWEMPKFVFDREMRK
ncbi:trimeric intracellular cation channel family protein [Devosia sp. XJ19-1]|uniref:Trimeric intracellular cation channel family protein n=1 Tax=Devosia ureilytica TaxID=2952754 RepID=A0A9Q4FRN3_9HYPH|nr:trimeric intracellular cation channel family protein [Devosia ureilytica]MCP8884038.1 trimeric intracellular cation channel family protein [Devosia ureilytica]MCP8887646.1 trimeric intracellular cation channel family protein [Devosia ureilytica]